MSGPGSTDVVLSLAVTSDYYVFPHNSSQFPSGPGQTNLLANISALFEAGASCAGGSKVCVPCTTLQYLKNQMANLNFSDVQRDVRQPG